MHKYPESLQTFHQGRVHCSQDGLVLRRFRFASMADRGIIGLGSQASGPIAEGSVCRSSRVEDEGGDGCLSPASVDAAELTEVAIGGFIVSSADYRSH